MFQLAAQLAQNCLDAAPTAIGSPSLPTSQDAGGASPADGSSGGGGGAAAPSGLIPAVFRSSWDAFKQEMAGGTGGTAGEALEVLLGLLMGTAWPEWAQLPVPGPALVSTLMTAYSYDK